MDTDTPWRLWLCLKARKATNEAGAAETMDGGIPQFRKVGLHLVPLIGLEVRVLLLALWSDEGELATWYRDSRGPVGLWKQWAEDVRGQAVRGGHFFPKEHRATLLRSFSSS